MKMLTPVTSLQTHCHSSSFTFIVPPCAELGLHPGEEGTLSARLPADAEQNRPLHQTELPASASSVGVFAFFFLAKESEALFSAAITVGNMRRRGGEEGWGGGGMMVTTHLERKGVSPATRTHAAHGGHVSVDMTPTALHLCARSKNYSDPRNCG